ncbi:aldolase [Bacillus niameyensis]|uniref:aldolase n=1 Tax=Bacillus niameyensis TaxID=1522308 RepID=UPI0007855D5D|nr:aldolase [Bacillus niameyensis]
MAITLKKIVYKAFGLHVQSDVPLPELPQIMGLGEDVDIVIQTKDLTDLWNDCAGSSPYFAMKGNMILFHIPGVAIYCIEDGMKIFVSPMKNAHADQIRLYILGSCMGGLLLQRRVLPLHGSAIAINGKAYAIVGESGAGKSTLAAAFLQKGYPLLSDDVIPITLSEETFPIVTPAYPQQKLWQESLDAFGIESKGYRPIIQRETKFAIPVSAQFSTSTFPLAGVFELVKTEGDQPSIEPILHLQRLHTLFQHTYRNFLLNHLKLREWHFQITAAIANQTQLYRIQRPIDRFTAHDLTAMILETLNKE